MKKKLFLKFFVLAVIGAFVTFTSCKDYDDDINKLQNDLNSLKSDLTSKIDNANKELSTTLTAEISKVASDLATAKSDLAATQKAVAAAETALADVKKQAGDNATAIEAAEKALAAAESDLDNAKKDIIAQAARLGVLEEFKATAEGDISTLKAQIVAVENALGTKASKEELNAAVTTLNGELDKLNKELTALKTEAATKVELAAAVEALEGKIAQVQSNLELAIAGVNGRLDVIEADYAKKQELANALATLKGELTIEIGKVQTGLTNLGIEVKAIDDAFKAFLGDFEGNVQDILKEIAKVKSDLGLRISTLEALLGLEDGTSTVLDGIAEELDTQFGLISKNTRDINTLIGQLSDQETALEKLIGEVKKELKGDIDDLDKKITGNANDITQLGKDLRKEIADEVKTLNKKIDNLDTELQGMINGVLKVVTNRLTSIALAPNVYVDGIEAIKFTSLIYHDCKINEGDNEEGEEGEEGVDAYSKSIGAPAVANYKFNPRTFDLDNAEYSYADRVAEVITRAAGSALVAIEGVKNADDGTVEFTLRRTDVLTTQQKGNKKNFIQLEATLKGDAIAEGEEGVVVAAHQELVYDEIITPRSIQIGDNAEKNQCGNHFKAYPTNLEQARGRAIYDMEYNKVFDLGSKVKACFGKTGLDIDDFNLKFTFDKIGEYLIDSEDTSTDQQKYFEVVDAEKGLFKAKDFNKEALGRTPIFKVELVDADGCVVKTAYVKVEVVVAKAPNLVFTQSGDIVYDCEGNSHFEYDVDFIREQVYRAIEGSTSVDGISHEIFWKTYEVTNTSVIKNGKPYPNMTAPRVVDGKPLAGVATKEVHWDFVHDQIGEIGKDGSKLVGELVLTNTMVTSDLPEKITFHFVVNVTLPELSVDKKENDLYWLKNGEEYVAFRVNVAVPADEESDADKAIFRTDLNDAFVKYELVGDAASCGAGEWVITATSPSGDKNKPLSGVQLDGGYITLDKNDATVKAALNSKNGLSATISYVVTINDEKVTVDQFGVVFIRPVNVTLPTASALKDAEDNGDVLEFGWNGLLTDWRGKQILPPYDYEIDVVGGEWSSQPIKKYEWVEGYYNETKPGSLVVTTEQVSFPLGSGSLTTYKGTATFKAYGLFNTETETVTTPSMFSKEDVDAYLELAYAQFKLVYWKAYTHEKSTFTYEEGTTTGENQTVSYTVITGVTYTPAEYEWIPGGLKDVTPAATAMPDRDGTKNGERVNEWVWVENVTTGSTTQPGQYWDFYGPFEIVIESDMTKVSTNLDYNGNVLPKDVSLIPNGFTGVKYVNDGTPITYTYEIYLPITVKYGWGEIKQDLTITVNPVN